MMSSGMLAPSGASSGMVFVVDDDPAARQSLRSLLESANLRVTTFATGQEFLQGFDASAPGCLILDVVMPGMNGLELLQHLARHRVHLPVIVVTGHPSVSMAVKTLRAGAVDYLEKPPLPDELLARVSSAVASDVLFHRRVGQRHVVEERLRELTPREHEVLELLVAGKAPKQIAGVLGTSPNTVRNQRASVLHKMRAPSVASLVEMVCTARLVGPWVDDDQRLSSEEFLRVDPPHAHRRT